VTFRLTAPRISENDVELACVHLLRYRHYYPLRIHSGRWKRDGRWTTIGEPGIPDYCVPRFFVEVKRPGGIVSIVQQKKFAELEGDPWRIPVVIVDTPEALREWLNEYES
jgi:hypothetical protein